MLKALAGLIVGLVLLSTASCFAVGGYGKSVWHDAVYQHKECLAAAGIALSYNSVREFADPAFKHGIRSFSPILTRPDEVASVLPVSWLFRLPWNRPIMASMFGVSQPESTNCGEVFKHLPIPTKHLDLNPAFPPKKGDPWPVNYHFSRIWLSHDGNEADLLVDTYCGNLCGSGWNTHWEKQNGYWKLTKKTLRWIA